VAAAQRVLLVLAVLWAVPGMIALALGLTAAPWLLSLLPAEVVELTDAAQVGGAAVALGSGLLLVSAAHLAVEVWLWRRAPAAVTVGVLFAGLLGAALLGSAVAAVTSAATSPAAALALLAGAGVLLAAAACYGWCAVRIGRSAWSEAHERG
jgi:hypothetical protein